MLYVNSKKMTPNSKQNKQNIQNTEREKNNSLKEKKENEDLYNFILIKIITTYEEKTK